MGKKNTESPDYSAAITAMSQQSAAAQMYASDNQYQLGMASIGAQMLQSEGMYNLGQAQIQANLDMGRERLQTSLEIARLNYLNSMTAEEDRHVERLAEQDLRRYEIDKEFESEQLANQTVDTSGFFA